MNTKDFGTSLEKGGADPVGTDLMAFTTSMPDTTLPKTVYPNSLGLEVKFSRGILV
jgi:hypothetical protein